MECKDRIKKKKLFEVRCKELNAQKCIKSILIQKKLSTYIQSEITWYSEIILAAFFTKY